MMALPSNQPSYSDSWLLSQDFLGVSSSFPCSPDVAGGQQQRDTGGTGMSMSGMSYTCDLGADSQLAGLRREERHTEMELVNRALENVYSIAPEMTEKMVNEREKTEQELKQQTRLLNEKKKKLQEETKGLRDLQYEFSVLNKNTMLAQFECYENERSCRLLQEEIDRDLLDLGRLKLSLVTLRTDQTERQMKMKNCLSKITQHKLDVEKRETGSASHILLRDISENIEILEDEMLSLAGDAGYSLTDLKDGLSESRLKEEISNLIRYQRTIEGQVEYAQKQTDGQQAKIRQLEVECDVTKKRNAAQLRRLTSQVKEMRSREKYWTDQCTLIRQNIVLFNKQYNS